MEQMMTEVEEDLEMDQKKRWGSRAPGGSSAAVVLATTGADTAEVKFFRVP